MSSRSMALDVLVRLKDQLSGPLRGLRNQLQKITEFAKKIGLIGTAIATISFMAPIQEAAAFQQKLVDIAATANYSGAAAYKFVDEAKGKYEDLALKIGQYSDTIADGAGQMIAAGLDEKLVDQSIGSIGRAATAAHAQFSDMASVATSMMQTLKVPANQLDDSMAALVVSGKEGAFELRDMARYFPTLTGQMAKLGVTGREAINFLGAALQIARKGTSDPAEAANNLKNFLSKILAPVTIKNFQEAGVDIEAVMKDAATKGINPIEAVVQKISKLTGASGKEIDGLMQKAKSNGLEGADALGYVREQLVKLHGAGKLGGLFSDMQVMDFLIPMLGNIDEYKRIKEEVAKATGGMIDTDFDTQMQALNQQLTIFKEIGTQATREVGLAFGTWLPSINQGLMAALKWMRELDTATGGWVKQGLAFAGIGVIAAAALGALGIALPIIGAGLSAVAALLSPIGAALAGIAAAGVWIYKNWGTISPRLTAIWQSLKQRFFQMVDAIKDVGRRLVDTGRQLIDRYGPMIRDGFARAWNSIADAAPRVIASIRGAFGEIASFGGEAAVRFGPRIRAGLEQAGKDIQAGLENLKALFKGFSEGLNLDVDFSAWTIDDAKLAGFRALDAALNGIAAGWQAMKDFGSGFAPYLENIGKNIGGTLTNLVQTGEALGQLVSALARLAGIDTSSVANVFKVIGDLAGGTLEAATLSIRLLSEALLSITQFTADLASGKVDWSKLVPTGLADAWTTVSQKVTDFIAAVRALPGELAQIGIDAGKALVDGIQKALNGLVDWARDLPTRIGNAITGRGTEKAGADMGSLGGKLFGGSQGADKPANDNTVRDAVEKIKDVGKVTPPGRQPANDDGRAGSLEDFLNGPPRMPGKQAMAPAQAPTKQEVVVKSEVKVAVDGPGRVVSQSTPAPVAVPMNTNTGRAIGRV